MSKSNFESRQLKKREDHIEFIKCFSGKENKSKIDVDWLSRQEVHGVYINNKLQAGFVYEGFPLSNTFHDVDDKERSLFLAKHAENPKKILGLTCFWISNSERTNFLIKYTWAIFLSSLILKKTRLRYLVFTSTNSKLNAICEDQHIDKISSKKIKRGISSTFLIKTSWFNLFKFIKLIMTKPKL